MRQPENCMNSTSQIKVGCVLMASGLSCRFGQNKLLAVYDGDRFIDRALAVTDLPAFVSRIVVTRTKEVADLCRQISVDVILHEEPGRNNMVRLGMERMMDMDCVLFCPCDQPLLESSSVQALIDAFSKDDDIVRLSFDDRQGAPVLFGKAYFQELCQLPEKKGGGYVMMQHPEKVRLVQAGKAGELFDVDTPEDYAQLLKIEK